MKLQLILSTIIFSAFLTGISGEVNSATLSCHVFEGMHLHYKGDIYGIPSSTSPSLFPEICNQNLSSCNNNCQGALN